MLLSVNVGVMAYGSTAIGRVPKIWDKVEASRLGQGRAIFPN